ncbi:hypothetical protein E1287_15495 [Actinomadura sp. KC06]|uniref:hypothetical protein n=1 Tax=Actinomadura sp. KC06 TaxID=2530369 RepID=UPI0010479F5C|nr:hypothetical protein [Actinomadura sp. KC06]TDD34876.1 hypothetical protein E1287_15495 [Actinomadura sp. KC06]
MKRPSRAPRALALAALLALTGCGIRPTGVIDAGKPPSAEGYAATITLYLTHGGKLRPVTRPGVPGEPFLAIEQLAMQPTTQERGRGLRTEVRHPLDAYTVSSASDPVGTRSTLIVLPPGDRPMPPAWPRMAVAQIACTGEAIAGIERVRLWHAPDADKSGWGYATCDQFADLLE